MVGMVVAVAVERRRRRFEKWKGCNAYARQPHVHHAYMYLLYVLGTRKRKREIVICITCRRHMTHENSTLLDLQRIEDGLMD
jgi:hypothetical protein